MKEVEEEKREKPEQIQFFLTLQNKADNGEVRRRIQVNGLSDCLSY